MVDSVRERIIQDVITRVKLIRVVNGYNTEVGTDAVRATKTANIGTKQQVVVIPRNEESEKTRYGKMSHTFPVDIHAFVEMLPGVHNASRKSEAVYADLIKAVTRTDAPVSTLIKSVNHTGGGGVELAENETTLAGATATFEIEYITAMGDPTAQ